jgi:hypothetical protein
MLPVLREGREFEDLKLVLENIDFESNFSSEIKTLSDIKANSEFVIPHGLKTTPSSRIILRQTDGGYITDGTTEWTGRNIYLYNNGSHIRELKILILR